MRAERVLVGVLAPALDVEIARLDAPARREFGQISMRIVASDCSPIERKPAGGPIGSVTEPEAAGTVIEWAFSLVLMVQT